MKISNDFGNKLKGSIGEQVTASDWKGRNYLKAFAKPSNPSSTQQQEKRGWLADGMAVWQAYTSERKEAYYYHEKWHKEELSPLNSFLRLYLNAKEAGTTLPAVITGYKYIKDSVTSADIPLVTITEFRVGRTTPYRIVYKIAVKTPVHGVIAADERYSVLYEAPGYEDYFEYNILASTVPIGQIAMVPL